MGSKNMKPKSASEAAGKKLSGNAKKAAKQPTQRTAMERVMVMKPSGKKVMEWRPWGS